MNIILQYMIFILSMAQVSDTDVYKESLWEKESGSFQSRIKLQGLKIKYKNLQFL